MISAMHIGKVGFIFHPSELYSYYGLAIRRSSPLSETFVVGYTDGLIGYLTAAATNGNGEYEALTVPMILDIPPFTPTATAELAAAVMQLLEQTVASTYAISSFTSFSRKLMNNPGLTVQRAA